MRWITKIHTKHRYIKHKVYIDEKLGGKANP